MYMDWRLTRMARTASRLAMGVKVCDLVDLGAIARAFPSQTVEGILTETGKQSVRRSALPANVTLYYVIAMALCMQVSCREVLRWLLEGVSQLPGPGSRVRVACKSTITMARQRLGVEPAVRLHDAVVAPIAAKETKGAYYRRWHLVSLDASTMSIADSKSNEDAFGRPGASRGSSAFPQIRFSSLVESGTHMLFGTRMGAYSTSEITLASDSVKHLKPGMLCLADREFFGYALWKKAQATGADLLWRVKKNALLPCTKRLPDGSYLSKIYPSEKDRRDDRDGIVVRVIEYTLNGVPDAESIYRLVTTILSPEDAPARELAALYHERWEIETSLDELKTHLKGSKIVLRSKTAEMVRQEFYGLMMAHFAIRGLMHEAALKGDVDPDELSYVHAVRVVRRKLPQFAAFPPSHAESTACERTGRDS
jgi:hypothetical protein